MAKVILFGGNGFVGTAVAEKLVQQGVQVVCVSRHGSKPVHLEKSGAEWANQALWIKGDGAKPEMAVFEGATAVVSLVGSPPVPTFTSKAYEYQLYMNSVPNIGAIEGAKAAGVKHVVLMGAHIPSILKSDRFAYFRGKHLSRETAEAFADTSEQHSAAVIQPSAIYGVRHTVHGRRINIGLFMRPIAVLHNALPAFIKKVLPEPFVSVDTVAQCVVNACLQKQYRGKFTVISNTDIPELPALTNDPQ